MIKWVSFIVASGVLGFTAGGFASHFPGSSNDWASWVQAVGSIGAIVGAFLFGDRDARRRRAEGAAARQNLVDFAVLQVEQVSQCANTMSYRTFIQAWEETLRPSILQARRAIAVIRLDELGSPEAVFEFAAIQLSLDQYDELISDEIRKGTDGSETRRTLISIADLWAHTVGEKADTLARIVGRRRWSVQWDGRQESSQNQFAEEHV
ncbi:hypothetical protein OKW41_005991 [Paraburkholderia sp. UCT70]|uniref:hypothetical protein n=1 Tax=Paraburkholderia sp. UCT70 TaxID=2991068 RepID=UPI003D236B11